MLPCVKDLAADGSQYVRTALAGVVMEMAPALGKAATIEHLLPVFLSLLKDDFPDVRLNIIAKLDQARRSCDACCAMIYVCRAQRSSIVTRWDMAGGARGEKLVHPETAVRSTRRTTSQHASVLQRLP